MWIVHLTKTPIIYDWKPEYFPRKFTLKTDAKELLKEIRSKGGDGVIDRYKPR